MRDLFPKAPSFTTTDCGSGFHVLCRLLWQARLKQNPQIAQAYDALLRALDCLVISAAWNSCIRSA